MAEVRTLERKSESGVKPGSETYSGLLALIRETLIQGRREIERLKVETYWRTGRYIHEHFLHHQERADYGNRVLQRLAGDLGLNTRLLERTLQFYRTYPQIPTVRSELNWTHYRILMAVGDNKARLRLTEQAVKEEWTCEELQSKVSHILKKADLSKARLPLVCLGSFETYSVVKRQNIHSQKNELLLDLGFSQRLEAGIFPGVKFVEGLIVSSVKDKKGKYRLEKAPVQFDLGADANDPPLYTYKAYVEKVIDGDTLKLELHLGFGHRFTDKFRLKGIDCPEVKTSEGRAAKKFVESELAQAEYLTVKSNVSGRKGKWGRYVVDIFYSKKGSNRLIYLNQILLDRGYAVLIPNS
ncbi:MAG: thermonuclease family protein [Candidatus Omnitrophica bacterium]|nr:thermonuclease family protein [Candidatus Omnitrophota bacterium]